MATPDASPFKSENVMTLVMRAASDGSRNPVKPSSSPSVPPTAKPSIGFVKLILFTRTHRPRLPSNWRYGRWRAEALRSVPNDEPHDAARQNDSEIIVVHIESYQQCK